MSIFRARPFVSGGIGRAEGKHAIAAAIHFLLEAGQHSHGHQFDATIDSHTRPPSTAQAVSAGICCAIEQIENTFFVQYPHAQTRFRNSRAQQVLEAQAFFALVGFETAALDLLYVTELDV